MASLLDFLNSFAPDNKEWTYSRVEDESMPGGWQPTYNLGPVVSEPLTSAPPSVYNRAAPQDIGPRLPRDRASIAVSDPVAEVAKAATDEGMFGGMSLSDLFLPAAITGLGLTSPLLASRMATPFSPLSYGDPRIGGASRGLFGTTSEALLPYLRLLGGVGAYLYPTEMGNADVIGTTPGDGVFEGFNFVPYQE